MSTAMEMGRYTWGSRASAHDMRLLWRHKASAKGAGPTRQRAPPCPGLHRTGQGLPFSLSRKQPRPGDGPGDPAWMPGSWVSGGPRQAPACRALGQAVASGGGNTGIPVSQEKQARFRKATATHSWGHRGWE